MANRTEVVLSGLAGQGLVFAGGILADAVGVIEGKFVSQTASFGTAARTGPSRSEVIVGDEEVDFPAATLPDIVVALTEGDARKYTTKMRPGGILMVDSDQDPGKLDGDHAVYVLPLLSIVKEESAEEVAISLAALGALAAISGIVALASLEETVEKRFPLPKGEQNLRILKKGYEAGLKAREAQPQSGLRA